MRFYCCEIDLFVYLDIDECALGTDDCNVATSICNNTIGSYICTCRSGYQV
jgi:hypothetical protein